MEENNAPSIETALENDTPSEAEIMSALGMGSEAPTDELGAETQDSQDAEITEEIDHDIDEESSEEPLDMLEEAKKEAGLEEEGQDEGAEEASTDEEESEGSGEKAEESQVFEVKIDGEIEEVSLQDLKNDYSGRKAIAQRFTELDKEKKQLYNERSLIEKHIGTFAEKAKSGDIMAGVGYLAEIAGIPPYVFKEQLIAASRPEVERRYQLSEQEQQKELLSAELDYMKAQKESETKRQAAEQTKQELQTQVNSVRETHGITEEIWDQAYKALDKELPPEADLTIDDVRDRSLDIKATALSTNLLSEFNEVSEDAQGTLKKIILDNPNFTEDDLKGIIQASLDKAKSEAEETKAKELGSKLKTKVKTSAKPAKSKDNNNNNSQLNGIDIAAIDDWDDIL